MRGIGVRHTAIGVGSMEKMLPFYRDLLGMEICADFKDNSDYVQAITGVKGANIWTVNLRFISGATIQLHQYLSHPQEAPASKSACDRGLNHIAVEVDDIDALYEKLKASGVSFHAPPTVSTDSVAKVTYCRDPEGTMIELVEMLRPS